MQKLMLFYFDLFLKLVKLKVTILQINNRPLLSNPKTNLHSK